MADIAVKTQTGGSAGTVALADEIFGIEPNMAVMHQVVTAQLAARRSGTHSTLTRAEVRGGGAKPWRQKGTGRARQGSIRSPQWRGGGVAHGPKPRNYSQKTPKKMVRLALRSALSDRAAEDRVVVVDSWSFDSPKTKDAVAALDSLGTEGKVLLVLGDGDVTAWKSFRNLPSVHCLHVTELNTYDVLDADYIVFTKDTVPTPTSADERAAGTAGDVADATSSDEQDEPANEEADVADATSSDEQDEPANEEADVADATSSDEQDEPASEASES